MGRTKPYRDPTADETIKTMCGIPGELHILECSNPNVATDMFIHLYDEDNPTVAGSTPVLSFFVPPADAVGRGAMDKDFTKPLGFFNSIKYAITDSPLPAGGAPAADLMLNATYLPRG